MTSKQSVSNNCNRPLSGDISGNTFTGAWESSAGALVLGVFVASPTLGYVTIQQSNNRGVNIQLTDTFNVGPADLDAMTVFRVPSGFAWFRVTFHNDEGNQTYLSLNTYLESSYTAPATIAGDVTVTGTVAVSSVSGVVDVSGNVVSTPATSAAQLRHTPLVVGHWYQVASVGDTPGAVWAEMGAIWDGESTPPVGRQFQCLYAGYGTGTCYDITAPVDATATTLPTLSYDQGERGSLVAPHQLIGCKLMGTASTITGEEKWCNEGGAIPVFGTVGIDSGNNTVKIDPDNNIVVISDNILPLPVNIFNGTVGGFANIPVNIDSTNNVVKLDPASSLPAGSNIIGLVGFDTANNIVRIDDGTLPLPVSIDSTNNVVKLDPASSLPAGTNAIGSVTIFNSSVINTYTYADISGAWVGSAVDLRSYSLADFYMLAAGSVTLAGLDTAMNFLIQYSPNSIVWFNSGQSISLTTAIPQGTSVGILTASPYVRLIADPANDAGDVATDVTLWIPAKAI